MGMAFPIYLCVSISVLFLVLFMNNTSTHPMPDQMFILVFQIGGTYLTLSSWDGRNSRSASSGGHLNWWTFILSPVLGACAIYSPSFLPLRTMQEWEGILFLLPRKVILEMRINILKAYKWQYWDFCKHFFFQWTQLCYGASFSPFSRYWVLSNVSKVMYSVGGET